MKKSNLLSGRLFASNKHAPACLFRQSPNAKGSAESRSALGSLYSRQRCSRRRALRAAALHRFLGLSLRSAHSRRASIYGRSVGKAILRFHSEPYVTLHPRRGFAYIRHILLRRQGADFFDTAALCYVARAQTFRPLLLPALSAAFHK